VSRSRWRAARHLRSSPRASRPPWPARNISIAGGAATVNQDLRAGHIDELRLHIAPVLVGTGERLFDGVPPRRLELVGSRHASLVTHVTYRLPGA
jgi:dihydrofolate reductase